MIDKNILILSAQNMILTGAQDGWQQDSQLVLNAIDFLASTFALEAARNMAEVDRLTELHYYNTRRN